jgi:hypothetical protein
MATSIPTEEMPEMSPVCPHCSEELPTVWYRRLGAFFGKRYIYFCPYCRKVLGVTHRKGLLIN